MFCRKCGAELQEGAKFCPNCGASIEATQEAKKDSSLSDDLNKIVNPEGVSSPNSRLVAALLCFFLGSFGAHQFYVGKIGRGILMILL